MRLFNGLLCRILPGILLFHYFTVAQTPFCIVSNGVQECFQTRDDVGAVTVSKAAEVCGADGQALPTIISEYEQTQLNTALAVQSLQGRYWMGVRASLTTPQWYWHKKASGKMTHTPVTSPNWVQTPAADTTSLCGYIGAAALQITQEGVGPSLQWSATTCSSDKLAMCQYTTMDNQKHLILRKSQPLTWFEAQTACQSETESLFTLDSPADYTLLRTLYTELQLDTSQEFWIGLTAKQWFTDQELTKPAAFYNFQSNAMNPGLARMQLCASINVGEQNRGQWRVETCGVESRAFVLCQQSLPIGQTPSTAPPVTQPPTNAPVTDPSVDQTTIIPPAIKPTSNKFPPEFIVIIVVVVVLCIAVIVGIIVWICCCSKNTSQQPAQNNNNDGTYTAGTSSYYQPPSASAKASNEDFTIPQSAYINAASNNSTSTSSNGRQSYHPGENTSPVMVTTMKLAKTSSRSSSPSDHSSEMQISVKNRAKRPPGGNRSGGDSSGTSEALHPWGKGGSAALTSERIFRENNGATGRQEPWRRAPVATGYPRDSTVRDTMQIYGNLPTNTANGGSSATGTLEAQKGLSEVDSTTSYLYDVPNRTTTDLSSPGEFDDAIYRSPATSYLNPDSTDYSVDIVQPPKRFGPPSVHLGPNGQPMGGIKASDAPSNTTVSTKW